jgi:hypothetical protein
MARVAITTVDNPYDPLTQWAEWFQFDTSAGYHTVSLLARFVHDSFELSEADQEEAIELAIDEMVYENVTGMYRKVVEGETSFSS